MAELHFESKEVEEYYRKERRILGIGHPCRWDSQEVITKEDVDNYIKDAKNILCSPWYLITHIVLLFDNKKTSCLRT